MKDDLGDRMKAYEQKHSLHFGSDIIAVRIDGKAFHTFTKKYKRPYDPLITNAMDKAANAAALYSNAVAYYVQSDEISLLLKKDGNSQHFFDGKQQKLASVLASVATQYFSRALPDSDDVALFDARVWPIPDEGEAVNYLLWRMQDARRNSMNTFARSKLGHKEIQGVNSADVEKMLRYKDIFIEDEVDDRDRFGAFYVRKEKDVLVKQHYGDGIGAIRRRKYYDWVNVEQFMLTTFTTKKLITFYGEVMPDAVGN